MIPHPNGGGSGRGGGISPPNNNNGPIGMNQEKITYFLYNQMDTTTTQQSHYDTNEATTSTTYRIVEHTKVTTEEQDKLNTHSSFSISLHAIDS